MDSYYTELHELDNLRRAYEQIQANPRNYGIDAAVLRCREEKDVQHLLQQLSRDLQARTYKPTPPVQPLPATHAVERGREIVLRDLVVQAALQRLLEAAFPPAFPNAPEAEQTIRRLAGHIENGFSRVYAVNVEDCLAAARHKRILAAVRQRLNDANLIHLLAAILAAQDKTQPGLLAPVLADIALQSIDAILQQATAFGREENFLHAHCMRAGNQLVILLDQDPRYEWLLPAVQKRLHDELSSLHYDLAAVETQSLDLTRGGQLRFLGFEMRLVKGRGRASQVQYHALEEARDPSPSVPSRRRRQRRWQIPRFVQHAWNWLGLQRGFSLIQDAYRGVMAVQVSWRLLPIALYPVLVVLFGWRSPLTLLGLAAIFACNGRRATNIARAVGAWTRRHKQDAAMGACALASMIFLYPLVGDLLVNRSQEEAVPTLPPGFILGRYNKEWPWDREMVLYGLYVPPRFEREKGPFPLIVFLHGYAEHIKREIFRKELPSAIVRRVGSDGRNGSFTFAVLFPINATGQWQMGTPAVEDAMAVLDYVIARHRIDPARVYLTGVSQGGSGVWNLAEEYPNKWAAVVPLCSFTSPDVQKVRHIPAWIFHGAEDMEAPVERERNLVRQLQDVKADVRYTEIPNKGHNIWDVYDTTELYDWLASKKKD